MFTGASTYSQVAASQCFSPNASAHLGKVQQVTNFFSLGLQSVMLWYSPVDVFAWGLSTASVLTCAVWHTWHIAVQYVALLAYFVGSICITNLQHIDSDNFESYSDTFCLHSLHAMADRANYLFDMLSAEDKWMATTNQWSHMMHVTKMNLTQVKDLQEQTILHGLSDSYHSFRTTLRLLTSNTPRKRPYVGSRAQ